MLLTKHHGLGNDFLVVLDEANGRLPEITGELAHSLCERRRGIGADGLIHGAAPAPGDDVDAVMHLFNADGSRAEISGNGIRCLAHALALTREDHNLHCTIRTDVGDRHLVASGGPDFHMLEVSVGMGTAAAGPAIPAAVEALIQGRMATVSMGNPHLVVLVDDPHAVDLAVAGPAVETAFSGGINVEFIALVDPGSPGGVTDAIDLVVWERGVGITEACGTGACAAAHVAHGWGLVGDRVEVRMPGGAAEVALGDPITLIGPSSLIATVEWPDA